MPHPLWPLFDLRLSTERLVLRLPTDDELAALCTLARRGIHAPDETPFAVPWSITPSPAFERGFAQYHWSQRAGWTAQRWILELGAFLDGEPVGAQAVGANAFAALRTVFTGSWLGAAFQGRGLGKEMRAAVLGLAFDHLGAEVATSSAFADNPRSAGVSIALGYRENGIGRLAPQGVARDTRQFRMTREAWQSRPRPVVQVEGLKGCRELFGETDDRLALHDDEDALPARSARSRPEGSSWRGDPRSRATAGIDRELLPAPSIAF